ncbi:hypothetical protein GGX14DRAFT_605750 [Mycena pura]|uniref:Uncharacterized protein n=1 Tax=Mycena pura TaxID=153505 RepID=A0AAD6YJU3_9AGAR|nr:hypothetical protein GGX14DRAFT_605750 [Mycena pura]
MHAACEPALRCLNSLPSPTLPVAHENIKKLAGCWGLLALLISSSGTDRTCQAAQPRVPRVSRIREPRIIRNASPNDSRRPYKTRDVRAAVGRLRDDEMHADRDDLSAIFRGAWAWTNGDHPAASPISSRSRFWTLNKLIQWTLSKLIQVPCTPYAD